MAAAFFFAIDRNVHARIARRGAPGEVRNAGIRVRTLLGVVFSSSSLCSLLAGVDSDADSNSRSGSDSDSDLDLDTGSGSGSRWMSWGVSGRSSLKATWRAVLSVTVGGVCGAVGRWLRVGVFNSTVWVVSSLLMVTKFDLLCCFGTDRVISPPSADFEGSCCPWVRGHVKRR